MENGDFYEVYVNGGRVSTGRDAVAWAREGAERGAGEILLTSMDRDGTEEGYELELTRAVADAVDVPVIASGGAGRLEHLSEAITKGRRGRGPLRLDLPLRHLQRAAGEGAPARVRDPGAALAEYCDRALALACAGSSAVTLPQPVR